MKKRKKKNLRKAKLSKKRKIIKRKKVTKTKIVIEYYNRYFNELHLALDNSSYNSKIHSCRHDFWKLIPHNMYSGSDAIDIVNSYINSLEDRLKSIISIKSIFYWLHVYRRIAPIVNMGSEDKMTTFSVRSILESSFQKYGTSELGIDIGTSKEVPIEQIFGGKLMSNEYSLERQSINEMPPQAVLLKFGLTELIELYDCEKIAYEIWKATALFRIIEKGASLMVNLKSENLFSDDRSDDLNFLVTNFDSRNEKFRSLASATGIIFQDIKDQNQKGSILLPFYNIYSLNINLFQDAFNSIRKENVNYNLIPNFMIGRVDLGSYYHLHRPFSEGFKIKYDVSLEIVLLIVYYLTFVLIQDWVNPSSNELIRFFKRAYVGFSSKKEMLDDMKLTIPKISSHIGIKSSDIDCDEIEKGFEFWELHDSKRENISVRMGGPHYAILPIKNNDKNIIVDYAWIYERLRYLFVGVELKDQIFKGDLLEKYITVKKSTLPQSPCISLDDTKKQIDYSFEIDDVLIICECKVVSYSLSFYKGEKKALDFRTDKINNALIQLDDKVKWLKRNPIGKNYNISKFKKIISVIISPFVEYIPSLDEKYWLDKNIPRILTPLELKEITDNKNILNTSFNVVIL